MTTSTSPAKHGFASGIAIVAGAFLFIGSILTILQGISAIASDKIYVVAPDYLYSIDLTAWGWIHLVLGVIALLIAVGMMRRADWAMVAAIIIASLSLIVQFLWLPYYPWWSIIVIVLDIIVIWAAAVSRGADS